MSMKQTMAGPTSDLRITLVQTEMVWENPEANRVHFENLLGKIQEPTDLILLPEMFTTGFSMQPAKFAEQPEGPTEQWMAEVAKRMGAVVCGSIIAASGKGADSGYLNRLIWMRPDGTSEIYFKRHLFALAGEHENYVAGDRRLITELKGWRICPLICYDLRFPVWSRNLLDEKGRPAYDLLTYIASWPDKRIAHWSALLRARAIENQTWVAGVNRIGEDPNGFTHKGASALIDPNGAVVFERENVEAVATHTLSAQSLCKLREKLPFLQDADDFHIR